MKASTHILRIPICHDVAKSGFKEIVVSVYKIKIKTVDKISKVIPILRRFDNSLSIADIRRRITENEYVVEYDLLHYEITEDMAGIDRISTFKTLIQDLEDAGASVSIYDEDKLIDRTIFENSMSRLKEIKCEVEEDMDREAET